MRKILTLLVLCSSLALAGCGAGFLSNIQNPVSNNTMGGAISTYGILQSAVIAYSGLPRCTVTKPFSATNICYKRSVLVKAQSYDKAANEAINTAAEFQRNNPTLDASSYVTAAIAAVNTFKNFAIASQIPGIQGVQ